jgi:hypothetical protein
VTTGRRFVAIVSAAHPAIQWILCESVRHGAEYNEETRSNFHEAILAALKQSSKSGTIVFKNEKIVRFFMLSTNGFETALTPSSDECAVHEPLARAACLDNKMAESGSTSDDCDE